MNGAIMGPNEFTRASRDKAGAGCYIYELHGRRYRIARDGGDPRFWECGVWEEGPSKGWTVGTKHTPAGMFPSLRKAERALFDTVRFNAELEAHDQASTAFHDHPSNPSSCEVYREHHGTTTCPCEQHWRDHLPKGVS